MTLRFVKISPGGNPTVFLEAAQVEEKNRASVAAVLMHPNHLGAEQVGFVNTHAVPPSLVMMGGEFCLNATRAWGYELRRRRCLFPLADTEDLFGLIRVSGLENPVQVRITAGRNAPPDAPLDSSVSLTLPWDGRQKQELGEGLMLIRLPGIAHLLVDERYYPLPPNLHQAAGDWLDHFGLRQEAACGVIWQRTLEGQCRSITPLVWVAATGSMVAESACGSGSLALALALAPAEKIFLLQVLQPSGETISLRLQKNTPGYCLAEAGGMVSLIAQGETIFSP